MRWNIKEPKPKKYPKLGDTRDTLRFAWLPTRIGKEYVWLESYFVIQEYRTWQQTVTDLQEQEGEWYERKVDITIVDWVNIGRHF